MVQLCRRGSSSSTSIGAIKKGLNVVKVEYVDYLSRPDVRIEGWCDGQYSETGIWKAREHTNLSVKEMVGRGECFVDVYKSLVEVLDTSFNTVFVYLCRDSDSKGLTFHIHILENFDPSH